MKKILVREKEINVKDTWDDITLGEYGKILELYGGDNSIEEKFLVDFIAIISDIEPDFLMGLYDDELEQFVEIMNSFKVDGLTKKEMKQFTLNGRVYVVNQSNKLTLGEKISIKLLEKSSKDTWDSAVNLLSVLIRPAIERVNENGETVYEIHSFVGDIDVLTKRKELIKDIPATAALWILETFTPGRD